MRPNLFKPAHADLSGYTHPERLVDWLDYSDEECKEIGDAIDDAKSEADMQRFVTANPRCLVQHLGGGHGRWVIPQFRLGSHFVADFVIGEKHSGGHEWQLVELESPTSRLFNKNGDPSATLNHAIRQIDDWRSWLHQNQNLAARDLSDGGLGLTDIVGDCWGLVILGRAASLRAADNTRRRQMMRTRKIEIRTYDFLRERGGSPLWSRPNLGISDA